MQEIAKYIERKYFDTISFEEYMKFVNLYIGYFDENGEILIKGSDLILRLISNPIKTN